MSLTDTSLFCPLYLFGDIYSVPRHGSLQPRRGHRGGQELTVSTVWQGLRRVTTWKHGRTQLGLRGIYVESRRTRTLCRWVGMVGLGGGVTWQRLPGRGRRCHVWRPISIRRHRAQEWAELVKRRLKRETSWKLCGDHGIPLRKWTAESTEWRASFSVSLLQLQAWLIGLTLWIGAERIPQHVYLGGIRLKSIAREPRMPKEDLAVYILSGDDWEGEAESLFWLVG